MNDPYGPWATQIDARGKPQLNAFWRRRITRLPRIAGGEPRLSRSAAWALIAAAVLVAALPTLRGHAVSAEPASPAAEADSQQAAEGQLPPPRDDPKAPPEVEVAQARYNAAKAKAEDDVDVRYALAASALAKARYEANKKAQAKAPDSVPQQVLDELLLRCTEADLVVEKAKRDLRLAGEEARVAKAELEAARIPFARMSQREAEAALAKYALEVAEAKYSAAKAKAEDTIYVRYATAAAAVVKVEYEVSKKAEDKVPGSVGKEQLNELLLKCRQAELAIEKAKRDQRVAGEDANVAKAELEAAKRRAAGHSPSPTKEGASEARPAKAAAADFARRQRRAVEALRDFGFLYYRYSDTNRKASDPVAVHNLTSIDFFDDVVAVHLRGRAELSDAQLEHLSGLPRLEILEIFGNITGEGLRQLKPLGRLRVLHVQSAQITDDDLVHLQPLKNLTDLELYCSITEAGMQHLTPLNRLERLVYLKFPLNVQKNKLVWAIESPSSMDFRECPLTDALDYFCDYHAIKIDLDQPGPEGAEVTISARNVPLGTALTSVLTPLRLDWTIGPHGLVVTNQEALKKQRAAIAALRGALPSLKTICVEADVPAKTAP